MAQNDLKPSHSSSSEDEEEETPGSEDEQTSGSDSEGEVDLSGEKLTQVYKDVKDSHARFKSANKPQAPDLSSSETEESGSYTDTESDYDSTPKKSVVYGPNVKPISSIPMKGVGRNLDSKSVKTVRSKMISAPPPAKNKRPPPAPTAIEKDAKKAKQNTANGESKKASVASSQRANKPQAPDLSTSETEESCSETDTDSDSTPKKFAVPDPNIKPITSKPIEREGHYLDSKSAKTSGSKTVPTPPPAAYLESKSAKTSGSKTLPTPPPAAYSESKSAKKSGSKTVPTPPPAAYLESKSAKKSGSKTVLTPPPAAYLESNLAKKTGSKTVSTPPPAKSKPPRAPPTNEKDAKEGKKTTATDDDSKKQLFQRLWSEHDEIVILEGMIEYKNEKNGEIPIADMGAFHEFIKKSLHIDVSRAQLADKVRRLKMKYVIFSSRETNGKYRSFSKSHEQKGYELSKLIWGSNSNNGNNNTSGKESKTKNQSQKNGKLKGTVAGTSTAASMLKSNGVDDKDKLMGEVEKKMDISLFVRYGEMSGCPILSEEIVKAGMKLLDDSKRAELEAKWKKLKEQELELYVKRMELLKEQAQVVLEVVRSSGN